MIASVTSPRTAIRPKPRLLERTPLHLGTPRLEIIDSEAGFMGLADWWDHLLDNSAVRTPFLRWDWVSNWWKVYQDEFRLAVGVVRDGMNEPLAIAPLVIGRGDSGCRKHLRHLTFMGGIGEIVSEGMDFIIPRGSERALAPVLAEIFGRLGAAYDALYLPMVSEQSASLPYIMAAMHEVGAGVDCVERMASRVIRLPRTWEEYESQRSANWRSSLRRKWKAAKGKHEVRILQAGVDLDAAASHKLLMDLHRQRWGGNDSLFLRPRSQEFHRRLMERWLTRGRMLAPMIEVDGRVGAITYSFVDDGRAWQYQAGWDANHTDLSLGRLCMAESIRQAMVAGLDEFDFLPGDAPHKQQWTEDVRHVAHWECFRRGSARGALFRALRMAKRMAARQRAQTAPAANEEK